MSHCVDCCFKGAVSPRPGSSSPQDSTTLNMDNTKSSITTKQQSWSYHCYRTSFLFILCPCPCKTLHHILEVALQKHTPFTLYAPYAIYITGILNSRKQLQAGVSLDHVCLYNLTPSCGNSGIIRIWVRRKKSHITATVLYSVTTENTKHQR